MAFKDLWQKLKAFLVECKRVLLVTKKPTKDEFKAVLKITGIGTLIIGLMGFIINMAYLLIR